MENKLLVRYKIKLFSQSFSQGNSSITARVNREYLKSTVFNGVVI